MAPNRSRLAPAHRRAWGLAAVAVLGLVLAACSSAARTPTVPHPDLTPTAQVVIGTCPPGEKCFEPEGTSGTTNPPAPLGVYSTGSNPSPVRSVPNGATITVVNDASGTHRVTGTIKDTEIFDTGQLRPGESTVITLQTPGAIEIVDTTTGQRTTLTVRDTTTTTTS